MIRSILLLITLTSCVSGPLVVDVTQSSYQAEENHDVTLEWTFKTTTDGSFKSINIICEMFTDVRTFALFQLHEGVEAPESQHERFAGRVQFDKDVLREGRLRLHMSRLRTDDSGVYLCDVLTGDGEGSRKCHLNVTAERDRPKPETPNTTSGGRDASTAGSPSQAESPGWIVLYCGLGLIVVGTLLGVCCCLRRKYSMNHSQSTELDPMNHSLEPDPVVPPCRRR
ncbi:CD276 antigen-like isoform X2 [Anarhichas minor]|uniref:CD276 antigen-like isoform X2 n=1 Tax=Anarhichas minor TaxID=65739 RepID=UPI003F73AFA6